MKVTARTTLFAVLGDPVAHSLSPVMHNAAFRALGLDALYVAIRCATERTGPLMRTLVEAGGGGNVTVPHKVTAAQAVDLVEGPCRDACNTFGSRDGRVVGWNTDVEGVGDALTRLGAPASGGAWLLIGTGGAGRAVLAAAGLRGAGLAVRSRVPARRDAFLALARQAGTTVVAETVCDVVINATPLGLAPTDPLPVTPFETPSARWVLDLVYGEGETPMVQAYRERGVAASDGRDMLIAQGARSFGCWFPGVEPPVELMRAAVRDALG